MVHGRLASKNPDVDLCSSEKYDGDLSISLVTGQ